MSDQRNATIKTLARNIKANPDDSFSKFALALEFIKQENLQRAKLLFENIYHNDPEYVGVYYHLGKLYERMELYNEAQSVYNEGIEVAAKQKERRTKQEIQEALTQLEAEIDAQ